MTERQQHTSHSYNSTQKLDLSLADQPDRPLVVCMHGGGFISGSRDDRRCSQAVSILRQAGFNAASLSYTLAAADDRFSAWPRNLFDLADALAWLHDHAGRFGYRFERFALLGFSAGCCLSNLYIQGGRDIFEHFAYPTPVFSAGALVGFYGPYDFPSRQAERKSGNEELNRLHSPSWWICKRPSLQRPAVLHIQGDRDTVVYPDQHERFQQDYRERGLPFEAVVARGFGHSFAPRDRNEDGETLDLGGVITRFLERHLVAAGG